MVIFHSYVAVYQRVRSKFQRFALNDKEEEQVTAVNRSRTSGNTSQKRTQD